MAESGYRSVTSVTDIQSQRRFSGWIRI